MATGLPSGVVTISIISFGLLRLFSKTIIEKLDVPAETIAKREKAGRQVETYVLCKQGETSWETVDLENLL
jgi:hypothetical protein